MSLPAVSNASRGARCHAILAVLSGSTPSSVGIRRATSGHMRKALILGFVSISIAVPALAEAQPRRYYAAEPRRYHYEEREAYVEMQHTGLFVRGVLGAGGVTADDEFNDSTLSGGAGMFSLDLGGSISPGLALHGRLSGNSMFEPSVANDGQFAGELEETSLTFTLLGVGLTYYLPSNVYLTGVAGLSRAAFEFYGDEYDTLNGVGFNGDIGYEWALGRDLGLGIAARLELHSVQDEAGAISTGALGVLLSMTYF